MQTERFNQLRRNSLDLIFKEKVIVNVWRTVVRDQLRNLDIKDLFDHYDFNYNIEERATLIRNEVLSGNYRVSQPMIYRIEKKFGVCRHLVAPQPTDALILQVLVEHISKDILINQPSKNAFYSRDKHKKTNISDINDEYDMNWRTQWKKLQKIIYNFNKNKDFIAVTDLTNYYDSIDIKELRKVFTSYSKINEVVIDLLFRIIEEISWKPDYLPYSSRGLPTTNIEGIRLLAHMFLFEIDQVIKDKTNNNFARWMDDITIGIDSKKDGIEILSSISDMLKSRGLALNLSKTNIFNEEDGFYNFQIESNRYIDSVEKELLENMNFNIKKAQDDLDNRFKNHFDDISSKYWEKTTKRYITLYVKLEHKTLLNDLSNLYVDYPNLRSNFIYYLESIGYEENTLRSVMEIIKTIDIFDDRSLYQLCLLVTNWEIPLTNNSKSFLLDFENEVIKFAGKRNNSYDFYCLLWFKTKYNHADDLLRFIKENTATWQENSFLRRQVTATLSRLLNYDSYQVNIIMQNQITSGVSHAATVANQIISFSTLDKLDSKLNFYLFPKNKHRIYPLSKFLVLCSVLNSEKIRTNIKIKIKVLEHIKDPFYLRWIDAQYNIS